METVTFKLASGRPGVPDQIFTASLAAVAGGDSVIKLTGRNGESAKLQLLPDDVHVSEELATYAAGYKPYQFRADEMCEPVMVDNDFDQFRTLSSNNVFEAVPVKGAINGPMNFIDPSSSLDNYRVQYRFIGTVVNPITERNERKKFDSRRAAVNMIQTKILLDREIDVITMLTTLGNWNTAQRKTLGAGFEWNGGVDSEPVKDLQDRILESDQPGDEFWMNPLTAFTFLRHPNVREYMRQMYGDAAPTAIANAAGGGGIKDFSLVGIGTIKVAAARKRNLTTGKNDYIWPDGYVAHVVRTPGMPADMESIATCKTFRTKGPAGTGFGTRTYKMDGFGPEGVEVIAVFMAEDIKMTGPNCGGLLTGAIQ